MNLLTSHKAIELHNSKAKNKTTDRHICIMLYSFHYVLSSSQMKINPGPRSSFLNH